MSTQEEQQFDRAAKEILVKLVTALLMDKPKDPVLNTLLITNHDSYRSHTFTPTC